MPNKTIYLKDADLELWDRAQNELGDSLSSVFVDCLRKRLDPQKAAGNFQRIELLFEDEQRNPYSKAFMGIFFLGGAVAGQHLEIGDWRISAAETQRGQIAVYRHGTDAKGNKTVSPGLFVFKSLAALRKDVERNVAYGIPATALVAIEAAYARFKGGLEMDI